MVKRAPRMAGSTHRGKRGLRPPRPPRTQAADPSATALSTTVSALAFEPPWNQLVEVLLGAARRQGQRVDVRRVIGSFQGAVPGFERRRTEPQPVPIHIRRRRLRK